MDGRPGDPELAATLAVAPAITVLGSAAVLGPDGSVPIGSPLRRSLLTVLAVAGREVDRDELIEALWGDDAPRTAVNTLQVHVSALRKLLAACSDPEPPTIVGTGRSYRLAADDHQVDLRLAELLVGRAAHARRVGRHADVVALLTAALSLWRGPSLPDAPATTAIEAARLESIRLSAEDDRWAAMALTGRSTATIPELERGVAVEPLREHRVGLLALALLRAGRQADALAVLDRTRHLLRDELGCDPGPELLQVEHHVLAQRDTTEPAAPPSPASAGSLVGRSPDIAGLEEALGAHRLVALTGPAGVGTSAVAAAVARAHGEAGASVAALDLRRVGPVEDLPRALLGMVGATEHPLSEPTEQLVARLARYDLVVLDHADRHLSTIIPLALRLASDDTERRVLVCGRRRPDAPGIRAIALAPLRTPDPGDPPAAVFATPAVDLLVRLSQRSPATPAPSDVADRDEADAFGSIARASAGLPLALELAASRLRDLGARELARQLGESMAVLEPTGAAGDAAQTSVRAAVEWSFDQLDEAGQRVVEALSVIESSAPMELIEELVDGLVDRDHVAASVADLVAASIAARSDGSPARFSMLEPIRRTAADRLTVREWAGAVRDRHAEAVVRLAEREAGRLGGPARRGERDVLAGSLPDLRVALTHLCEVGDAAALHRALARLTFFWFTSGRLTEGRRWYRSARRLPGGRDADRLQSELGAAMLAWWQGDYADARRRLDAAEALVDTIRSPSGDLVEAPAALHLVRASLAWLDGDLDRAERSIDAAVEGSRRASPTQSMVATAMAGSISWHRGDHGAAVARYRLCASTAGGRGERWTRAFALRHEALMTALAGDHALAVTLERRVLDDDAPTDALSRGQALVLTGAAALERGDAVTARRRLESGIAVAAGPVDLPSILLAAADLAHLHHADGDLDDAALLLGWVEGCRAVLGLPIPPTQRARLDEVAGAVDSGTAAAARHRGSSLTLAELLSMLGLGDV